MTGLDVAAAAAGDRNSITSLPLETAAATTSEEQMKDRAVDRRYTLRLIGRIAIRRAIASARLLSSAGVSGA